VSKEIILIKELTRIKDLGQSFVQYRNDRHPSLNECNDYRENYHYEAYNCEVKFFAQLKEWVTKRIRFAFSPEVEKEFSIIFDVINDYGDEVFELSATIERLRMDRDSLSGIVNDIKSMSFWQRVKFVFNGRVE